MPTHDHDKTVVINNDPARLPSELRNTWDGRARRAFLRNWPPQRLLPDVKPVYVCSWFYTLGVATLAGLVLLFASGIALVVSRALTWMLGVLSFARAAVTTGLGDFLNLLDVGQVLTLHVIVMPLLLMVLVLAHLLAVRRRGICPPYDANPAHRTVSSGE